MAYEPTEWKKGDTITAEKLNKIEGALAGSGGGLVVHINGAPDGDTPSTLDKTYEEIHNAVMSGTSVTALLDNGNGSVDVFKVGRLIVGGSFRVWLYTLYSNNSIIGYDYVSASADGVLYYEPHE